MAEQTVDDVIASIIRSLSELADTEVAEAVLASLNEMIVAQSGRGRAESRRSGAPEDEPEPSAEVRGSDVVDLSVLVAPELPSNWPSPFLPPLIVKHYLRHGPGPQASEAIVIDEHTGTHWDAPAHFIPPPSTGLPNAADSGAVPSDQIPAWQFVGEACVVDVQDLAIGPAPGVSSLILPEHVQSWEAAHRPLRPGDVVLFKTGYSDRFYKPFPEGRRYVADPLSAAFAPGSSNAPGYPGLDPTCMDYLVKKRVLWVGIDGPNIGPLDPKNPAATFQTHVSALSNSVLIVENLTYLKSLPSSGALVAILGPKHANGSGGEARIVGIKDARLATRLIASARSQKMVDLSVLLREDLPVSWPGLGLGNHRMPYLGRTLHSWDQPGGPALVRNHMLDAHVGTHLVPPAFAVPRAGFDRSRYDEPTRNALDAFESRYGALGHNDTTADRVPVSQLCGWARVIDVTHLVGTGAPGKSPAIGVEEVERHEHRCDRIQPGEIVIFRSGHTDRYFRPFPYGQRCLGDPLTFQAEGWPAPTAETIIHLASRGVRCVGTDGPNMGGTDPVAAQEVYWAGGQHCLSFVEFLIDVGVLPLTGWYFLFAPVKIAGVHGGYGRAFGLF